MKYVKIACMFLLASLAGTCNAATQSTPTQVVYRFDDHRYLELKGFECEGALWFTDTRRNIHTEITSQFYRLFTKTYIHPSERYIAVVYNDVSGFLISKDYGKTWDRARFSPGGGAKKYASSSPNKDEVESFTVVNDQGFMLTNTGDIYMSSKPFDDPRLKPGGSGIDYTYTSKRGASAHHLDPMDASVGSRWGKDYVSWNSVQLPMPWQTFAYQTNFQGIPNKVPEVKNYTGWDHMRCDPNLGVTAK